MMVMTSGLQCGDVTFLDDVIIPDNFDDVMFLDKVDDVI